MLISVIYLKSGFIWAALSGWIQIKTASILPVLKQVLAGLQSNCLQIAMQAVIILRVQINLQQLQQVLYSQLLVRLSRNWDSTFLKI